MLGKVLAEINSNGQKQKEYVYGANGEAIARREAGAVKWLQSAPLIGNSWETATNGSLIDGKEYEPFGGEIPLTVPPAGSPDWLYAGTYQTSGNPYDGNSGCLENGGPGECSQVVKALVCVGNPRCMGGGLSRGLGYVLGGLRVKTWKGTSGRVAPALPADTGGKDDQPIVINQQGNGGVWIDSFLPVSFIPPQYDKCLEVFGGEAAGIKNGLLNSIPQTGYFGGGSLTTINVTALEMLQTVARLETVNGDPDRTISATLLAVVWHGELGGVGDFTASANVSKSKGKNSGAVDYGPFQLNYNRIKSEVAGGLYKIDDFGEKAVFGSKTVSPNTAFDGDPQANMRVAARKLLANGGIQDRNRVKAYVGGINWAATRQVHFDNYYPKWQSFFNCIK